MIEFHFTIFMCSYCTHVHNAAHDCLQHEREEHTEAETKLTPSTIVCLTKVEILSKSPCESTVASLATNAVPATVGSHADQHAEQSALTTSTQPITDETEPPFAPVEQPLIVMKPDIEEEERPVTPSTSSICVKMELPETVNSPNCRRVTPATSTPRVSVPVHVSSGRRACPDCEKQIHKGRPFRRHRRVHHPDRYGSIIIGYERERANKRARQTEECYSKTRICPECSFGAIKVLDYKQHVRSHRRTFKSPKIPREKHF